jgi:sulfofructose kinase
MLPPVPSADRPVDVVGVGATSVDYVYRLPAYPAPAAALTKLKISGHSVSCGGQIATALSACARFGLRTRFVGAVGNDANAAEIRRQLAERGVDLSGAVVRDAPNQYAVILLDDQSGERVVLWDRSDALTLHDGDLTEEVVASARVVHVDDVDVEASIRAATLARTTGTVSTTDIDRVNDRALELAKAATIPIFAEHVPASFTGISDPEGALRALRRHHAGVLCVTLGVQGAIALDGDRIVRAPAFAVHAVDTTGAGDVFRGGFIHGYLSGWPLEDILRFANAAAAVSCTRAGAMASVPTVDEAARLIAAAPAIR